jgi:hypothetical protein
MSAEMKIVFIIKRGCSVIVSFGTNQEEKKPALSR